tara:strand:+ start:241 stop:360 length:120 start_codon:yes stop_codon:yes gene_type:complete
MEFDIDDPAVYQVWVSSMGNIGYELTGGKTLVCYGVQEL